jgi:peroxiredoxin Q/BCP
MAKSQPLTVGSAAPDFRLPASTGGEISLADFRGKQVVVLYFYPKDMTPGCTAEACSFRDLRKEFAAAGAAILGVSPDPLDSHAKFTEKEHLNFPLLYDEGGKVATQYGAYGEKSYMGKTHLGNFRVTYLIDQAGKIAQVWPEVSVSGPKGDTHADEVLEAVKQLVGTAP